MSRRLKIFSRCEGAAAVEFAIIIPLFLFLVLGGMDLAHMFYIEHIVTTASREGARFAAKYTLGTPPSTADIASYTKSKVLSPVDALDVPAPTYTTVAAVPPSPAYQIVTVTVTAQKHWWVLATFNFYDWVPFPNPQTITGKTSMRVEY